MKLASHRVALLVFLLLSTLLLPAELVAQERRKHGDARIAKEYFTNEEYGFAFRSRSGPESFVPLRPGEYDQGILAKGDGFFVVRMDPSAPAGGPISRTLAEALDRHLDLEEQEAGVPEGDPEDFTSNKDVTGRYQRWRTPYFDTTMERDEERLVDTWTFDLEDASIALVYHERSTYPVTLVRAYEKSAKTVKTVERVPRPVLSEDATYEERLRYHAWEASLCPGWRVLSTSSKKYVVVTSHDDDAFLEEVVLYLEAARALFEEDFPAGSELDHVSVVRVCSGIDDFLRYSETRDQGVTGWFDPQTTELVFYDAQNVDRNMTYAVACHEAFHQYCHFLFDGAPAHPWFDEGHGDYYGGLEVRRGKGTIGPKMPSGLERLGGIREMIRTDTALPVGQHIRQGWGAWGEQGPRSTSGYEQSWSIVYMLREGARGNVPDNLWQPEYARIIPDYMRALSEHHRAALAESGEDELEDEQLYAVWAQAIQESWGKIDVLQFEEHWREYVVKKLK